MIIKEKEKEKEKREEERKRRILGKINPSLGLLIIRININPVEDYNNIRFLYT